MAAIEEELVAQIRKLDPVQQRQVLDFVWTMTRPVGEPLSNIRQHARELEFPHGDLEQIKQFVEQGLY